MGLVSEKKILVVDDDQDIREIIMMILETEGYTVCGLDNGQAVLPTVQVFQPDIILLDVMLGDMDGRDICSQLKSQPQTQNIAVIMVSATHSRPGPQDTHYPADDYISKPFDIAELVEQVKHYAA